MTGTMARLPDLRPFAAEHGLKIGNYVDLIESTAAATSPIEKIAPQSANPV
jgi:3,4-dihydroxy 2-butanone 4-phosphate synthase/GTP cyclohydrolase II